MAAAVLTKTPKSLLSKTLTLTPTRLISIFPVLSQEPLLQEPPPSSSSSSFPPNPSSGSPFYQQNWRNPNPPPVFSQSLVPVGQVDARMMALSQTLDSSGLMDVFADWMTSQRWPDLKQLFEFWIRSLDASGKPNKPDVNLFNHYLRANLMMGATAGELLDLVVQMEEYEIVPNTASYGLVLKAMCRDGESEAAEKLIEKMMQTGTIPDDESYNLVIGLLLSINQLDPAVKYLDLMLKSGNMVSLKVFMDSILGCLLEERSEHSSYCTLFLGEEPLPNLTQILE